MLFSDIEGSTLLLSRLGEAYAQALDAHRALLRAAWSAHDGVELGTEGDSFFVVFATAGQAVAAALQAQRALAAHEWPAGAALHVRVGLHTGSPMVHNDGYVGIDVHRAARVAAAAHGGQVVLSDATAHLMSGILPDDVRLLDLGVHRLKDIAQPERLYQLAAPDLPSAFPALRTLGAVSSLPSPATPLVGRAGDLQMLSGLLTQPGVRLITLTGTGGAGKTRLAIELARRLSSSFDDGAYFVPLADVRTAAVVWTTIGEVLDLPPAARTPPGFFDFIRHRHALYVLDNVEQIPDAAGVVDQFLAGAPRAAVVATSRRALHVPGEHEHLVPPLALSGGAGGQHSEAVELFVQGARMVKSDFALDAASAADVDIICDRLDGLPLAIEIVAARSKLLSPHALLARLDSALDLASSYERRPERQHTLRHTVAWSHELLSTERQQSFRRLAVFAGGADLGAVVAVCTPAADPLDVVTDLVDASLLTVDQDGDREPRVRLLQTIRGFALDELTASGELDAVQQRHAQHFAGLAETMRAWAHRRHELGARERLELENDNLREALRWALAPVTNSGADVNPGRTRVALRLCRDLAWFWRRSGYYAEGRQWLERALGAADGESPEFAECLEALARMLYVQGDAAAARDFAARSVELSRRFDDAAKLATALRVQAPIEDQLGAAGTARSLLTESVTIARAAGERAALSYALVDLSILETGAGNVARGLELLDEAEALSADLGDEAQVLGCRHNVACALRSMGRLDDARRRMEDLIQDTLRQRSPILSIVLAEDYAAVLADVDQPAVAARLLGTAEAARARSHIPRPAYQQAELTGAVSRAKSALAPSDWTREYARGANETIEDVLTELRNSGSQRAAQ